jgi:hypothetical protein
VCQSSGIENKENKKNPKTTPCQMLFMSSPNPRQTLPKASSIDLGGAKDDQEGETKVGRQ